ncbi:MAG TPA: MFS transporter [Symbiobacteriaceae bacterium]|nr:MFS transporter [Symbiobacteriaceae bacterium]
MTSLLRNRPLMLMGAAEVINSLGSWITAMALYSILIFQEGGGMAISSAIFFASLGPTLLLSPFAGWLCDRYDRRTLMIASRLLQGAATAGLIFTNNLPLIYTLLVASAVFGLVMGPARTTAMPDVVAPAELTQANAFMQQVTGTIKILAPALAGGLLTVMDPHLAISLDVVSFLLSAAVLLLLPPLPAKGAPVLATGKPVKEKGLLRDSLALLQRHIPGLLLLLPLNVLMALVIMAFDVAMAVYVRDILQATIAFKGFIGFAVGGGMIAGSSAFLFLKGERNLWRDVMVGFLLVTALSVAMALGEVAGPAAARLILLGACVLGGVGMGVINVQAGVLFIKLCPQGMLGRIGGLFDSVSTTGRLVGLLLTPILVPHVVSFGGYFGTASVLLLAAIAFTAVALQRRGATAEASARVASQAGASRIQAAEPNERHEVVVHGA